MYVTLEELKQSLELQGETYADDDLRLALESATAVVESMCGRSFAVPGDDDTTREYRAERTSWIGIDDLAEFTSAESQDGDETTTWETGDYQLEPFNAAADGRPYTVLRLTNSREFYPPTTRIRVTGKFGWPEVPAGVKEATFILAARLVKRVREAPFGIAGMGTDGLAVRVSQSDPDVGMLLRPYMKQRRLA